MKQTLDMVPRSVYFPIYDITPVHLKLQLIEKLGFTDTCSNFGRRKFITKEQHEIMLGFKDDHELMSKNKVGKPVPYDHEQMVHHNKTLVQLITSKDFRIDKKDDPINGYTQAERSKITDIQLDLQRKINAY